MTKLFINFGNTSTPAVPFTYNNFLEASGNVVGVVSSDLIDDTNASTGYVLSCDSVLQNAFSVSFTANGTVFPDDVYTEGWAGSNGNTGEYVISGLTSGDSFTLEVAGWNPNLRDTSYTVNGTSLTYDLGSTTDVQDPVIFTGVVPNDGNITLNAVSTSANGIAYLSALTLELTPSPLTITSITNPTVSGQTITVVGEAYEAVKGTGVVTQQQGELNQELSTTSWSDTGFDATTADIESSSFKYGNCLLLASNNTGNTTSEAFVAVPAAGTSYTDIMSLVYSGDRLKPLAIGNQVSHQSVLYEQGVATSHAVVVNSNGTFSIGAGDVIPNGTYTFTFRIYNHVYNTWGSVGTQTIIINAADTVDTSEIVMTNTGVPDGVYSFKIYNDSTNTLIEVKDITFSGGSATTTVAVATGTPFLVFSKGSNPPTTGMAYDGVTQ